MDIVDAHVNLRYPGERPPHDETLWPTLRERLALLRETGVSRAVVCRNESVDGCDYEELVFRNATIARTCEAFPDMLIPAASVQPALGERACDLLRRCRHELGMRFIGEMFDAFLGFEWGTAEYYRTLECAVSMRMVPIIHCQNEVIHDIADRYPDGRFLIAHLNTGSEESYHVRCDVMAPHPNLSLLISGAAIAQAGAVRGAVTALGAHRVVFGSDVGATDPVVAVMCVSRSGLSQQDQARILAGNFWELWRWTGSEGEA